MPIPEVGIQSTKNSCSWVRTILPPTILLFGTIRQIAGQVDLRCQACLKTQFLLAMLLTAILPMGMETFTTAAAEAPAAMMSLDTTWRITLGASYRTILRRQMRITIAVLASRIFLTWAASFG